MNLSSINILYNPLYFEFSKFFQQKPSPSSSVFLIGVFLIYFLEKYEDKPGSLDNRPAIMENILTLVGEHSNISEFDLLQALDLLYFAVINNQNNSYISRD